MYIILSSLFAVMIIAIIFIISKGQAKARTRKQMLANQLQTVAAEHQISWTESELQTHRAIAWHQEKRLLLFAHITDGQMNSQLAHMDTVRKCNIIEQMQFPNLPATNSENYVKEVWLELQMPTQEVKRLCFYQELQDGVFEKTRLTQKAQHYKSLIEKQ
ncbi:MAG: hypothetical protein IT256_06875 [Chitinophagaceae bacterium]|nr:hypothetical protein [Chitinophagaceae bacterium]